MIAIIDYDAGNLRSVEKAMNYLGYETIVTRDPEQILKADHVILPGVGSFGDAMNKLHNYKLVEVIHQVVKNQIPLLGICLGLQLLFETSEEAPGVQGLGLLKGALVKIPEATGIKVPQIGWNDLTINPNSKLLEGIKEHSYVYFVHSYYLQAKNLEEVAATTEYSTLIHAAVESGHVYGCQFHPEKSGDIGLQILNNFANLS